MHMAAALAGCRKASVGTDLGIPLLLAQTGSAFLVSHVAIQYFGFTGVIIFCFIFSQQVKELQNYILKVELDSSSRSSRRSSRMSSSQGNGQSSSQTSGQSSGPSSSIRKRKRHFSDLEVSSCMSSSYSCHFCLTFCVFIS